MHEATQEEQNVNQLTIGQIVDQIAVFLQDEENVDRKRFEELQATFVQRRKQMEQDGTVDAEQLALQEVRLSDLIQQFKSIERKRSEALATVQRENGAKAEALLDELETLLKSHADFGQIYTRFHEIRSSWETLRPLNQQDESRLSKRFVKLRSDFYELKDINTELRDYDFKKNLEQKQSLLSDLRALLEEQDIVSALSRLNNEIVPRWRDVGPVAHELRTEIEGAYKSISTEIFKKHQDYQDGVKAGEEDNAEQKRKLIERIKVYLEEQLPQTAKEWGTASDAIKALQTEWNSIGGAGRKVNHELYQLYRELCNKFFDMRNEYYAQRNQEQSEGISLRKALIERANELGKSDKYAETAEALKALQEEWKQLGRIRKSDGDALWAEFRKPFETFFERKRQHDSKQGRQAKQNESLKRQLLDELKSLSEQSELPARLKDTLGDIKERWRKVGRASAKVNDALWEEFCLLNDGLYTRLRVLQGEKRSEQLRSRHERLSQDPTALKEELQILHRKADRLRAELRNYDNNINFLTSSTKGDNPLLREVERKRQSLSQDLKRVEEEIKVLKS